MAYTPTEWQSGDIVTSAKLNKIENGIAGTNGLCVLTDYTLNKSYNDLVAMVNGGIIPFLYRDGYLYILGTLDVNGDGIAFKANTDAGSNIFFIAPEGDPDSNLIID